MFNFIRRHFNNLIRAFSWFLHGYKNPDWDYNFLYKVIYKKLTDMEKAIRKGHHLSRNSEARLIKICRWYLERIIKDDVLTNVSDLFHEKYGEIKFNFKPFKRDGDKEEWYELTTTTYSKCKTKKENEYANKLSSRIFKMERDRLVRYRTRFFFIMNKYIEYWWD